MEEDESKSHLYLKSTLKSFLEDSPFEDINVSGDVLLDSGMLKFKFEPPLDLTLQSPLQRALSGDTPDAYCIAAEAIIQ